MVDAVVVCPDQAQTYRDRFEPALAGLVKAVVADEPADPLTGVKRPIVMRAAQELTPDTVINFGFGISAAVADVIAAEGRRAEFRTTVEQGLHGGQPRHWRLFWHGDQSRNHRAVDHAIRFSTMAAVCTRRFSAWPNSTVPATSTLAISTAI